MNATEILVFLSSRKKAVNIISFMSSGMGHSFSTFTLIPVKNDYCYSFFLYRLYDRDNRHMAILPPSVLTTVTRLKVGLEKEILEPTSCVCTIITPSPGT